MEASPTILEWYRVDPWPRMRRVLIGGPALLTAGGLVVAVSFLTRQPNHVRVEAAALGLVLTAGGAIFTMAGMHRILREDSYLAMRTDGLALRSPSFETRIAWSELECVTWDASRNELVLERSGGEAFVFPRPFARISGPVLAQRIEQMRRRIEMGLVR
jgi:hypothetical protein